MMQKIYYKYNIDLFFLSIYFFSLPIAHFAAVQSISSILFLITFFLLYSRNIKYKLLLEYKNILFVFIFTLFLALISLFNTPDIIESLKEIKGEIVVNFFILYIFFYYTILINEDKFKKIIFIILGVLTIHTFINIYIWYIHGGWPYRAGGLLDSGGGERFGIWATYMLSASIALFFIRKYKKVAFVLLILSIISIIGNQTRATFVSATLIFIIYFFFFVSNKKIKFIVLSTLIIIFGLFYNFSSYLPQRYNIKHTISILGKTIQTPPNKFQNIGIEYSTYTRLAMWKSVILYRLKDPFVPQEYGRFLYGKSIKEKFKNQPQNLPVHIYAQTHNEFIGMLYALGIFGLSIFVYFLYFQLKISYQIYKITSIKSYKFLAIFTFLGTTGFIGSMMFGSFFGDSETKFFFPLYGMILGIYYRLKNEKSISDKSK